MVGSAGSLRRAGAHLVSSKVVLGGSVKKQELERLRQAMTRLIGAHEEALDAARRGLEVGSAYSTDEEQLRDTSEHLEAALVDVMDILEGVSEDVRGILGATAEEQGEGEAT
jgi:hypothetical protein